MAFISDKFQDNKLKKYNINIKTTYICDGNILVRNTDNSKNDNIVNGIRIRKDYYINNNLLHTENKFDSRIEYSFIVSDNLNVEYTCPNCGHVDKLSKFSSGCPYCGTYYNIDYTDKDLGSKYHYDRVLRNTKYRIVTYIIDLIISLIISYIYIKTTSRTFIEIDKLKIIIFGFILSLILYYLFYILDAYIILGPIKEYKDRLNQKQIDFWNRTKIDKKNFYNNFNYEVRKYYYSKDNIIDFDIIDFDYFNEYNKNNNYYVKVKAYVRIIEYNGNSFKTKYVEDEYDFKKIDSKKVELKDGENIIMCPNCNSSIDVTSGKCNYCGYVIGSLQEWVLEKK